MPFSVKYFSVPHCISEKYPDPSHSSQGVFTKLRRLSSCFVTWRQLISVLVSLLSVFAVTYWMSAVNERWNICRFAAASSFIISYLLCSVSLLTLTAISVDRLLALLLGLRYRQVVTLKRTCVTVIVFWLVSILGSIFYLWNYVIFLWYLDIGIPLCLVTSIYSYARTFHAASSSNGSVISPGDSKIL